MWKIWRNMKEIWRYTKKYVDNMLEYERNMTIYEEIWRKYEYVKNTSKIWRNMKKYVDILDLTFLYLYEPQDLEKFRSPPSILKNVKNDLHFLARPRNFFLALTWRNAKEVPNMTHHVDKWIWCHTLIEKFNFYIR